MTPTTLALPPRYRGAELVANGGMADVYAATDDVLGRRVAVKVLGDRFAHDPDIRARFTREARIAAQLSTEHEIVTIFDVVEIEGRPAIVMQYVSGGTVADRLRRGRISPALALTWLAQAARALDAAHGAGVVHRDIKPANLMVTAEGDVRVTDFGIARIAGDASLTSVGTVLGTSGYMSPEQAAGGRATAASDRYALGVVAFELLTGRRPFLADTFAGEAAAHATAPVPRATSIDRSLPRAADTILARALAKDPADRFRSCGEMVAVLRTAFSDSAGTTMRIPAVAAPSSRADRRTGGGRRIALVAAGLVALALLGTVAAVLATRDGSGEALEATTVMRTATVEGQARVRTVTVTSQTAAPGSAPRTEVTPTTSQSPSSLNDRGYALLRSGNPTAAEPLLEQAVARVQGSGSLTEAYAAYNLALARFSTGDCTGVEDLLKRSQDIQGKRKEIDRLRHDVDRACKGQR